MKKRLLFLSAFFATGFASLNAQECTAPSSSGNYNCEKQRLFKCKPDVIVKLMPLSLIDKEPNYQAGLELRLFKGISINQDIGMFLPAFQWYPTFGLSDRRGYLLKTELKWYPQYKADKKLEGFYYGLQAFVKYVKNTSFRTDLFSCDNSNDWVYVYYDKVVRGGHVKIGYQYATKRIYTDFYVGLGWRTIARYYNKVYDFPIEELKNFYDGGEFAPAFEYLSVPSMQAGVRLGIKL